LAEEKFKTFKKDFEQNLPKDQQSNFVNTEALDKKTAEIDNLNSEIEKLKIEIKSQNSLN
jgi:hypothetical protein